MARGLFSGQLSDNHGQPNTYGVDPVQFYGEAYVPTIGEGLDIKVGRFFALYGIESIDAISNQLASHSYTDVYDPFTHTGLVTTWKLTKVWTVQAGLVLGSDVFIDPADEPTFIGTVKWAPPSGRDSVLVSMILGSGRYNQGRAFNNPDVFDLVYTHQINPRLNYSLETLYGMQNNVPDLGHTHWGSVMNYLTYTISPRLNVTGRLEFFDDAQGQRTGFAGLCVRLDGGLAFSTSTVGDFPPRGALRLQRPVAALPGQPRLVHHHGGCDCAVVRFSGARKLCKVANPGGREHPRLFRRLFLSLIHNRLNNNNNLRYYLRCRRSRHHNCQPITAHEPFSVVGKWQQLRRWWSFVEAQEWTFPQSMCRTNRPATTFL